jgi:transposase InsO family protein
MTSVWAQKSPVQPCTNRKRDRYAFTHSFDRVCYEHGIEHRRTKPNHPWTNGHVERMNRALKDATVNRYHYGSRQELKVHLYKPRHMICPI